MTHSERRAYSYAGIVFKAGRYFSTVWFVNSADNTLDWYGAVWRDEGGDWRGAYRFRYYRDAKVIDSKDEKSWYAVLFPPQTKEQVVVSALQLVADMVAKDHGGEIHKVLLRTSNTQKILEMLKREPWFHVIGGGEVTVKNR